MAFKKHKWMSYGKRGNIIEIKIKDESDRIIDTFKCNNQEAFKVIAGIIKQKYGYNFNQDKEDESVDKEEEIKKEKDWLEKDMEW